MRARTLLGIILEALLVVGIIGGIGYMGFKRLADDPPETQEVYRP